MAKVRKQNILLTLWLALPFVAVATICVLIVVYFDDPSMPNSRRGVGAEETGGANFIGEKIFGDRGSSRNGADAPGDGNDANAADENAEEDVGSDSEPEGDEEPSGDP